MVVDDVVPKHRVSGERYVQTVRRTLQPKTLVWMGNPHRTRREIDAVVQGQHVRRGGGARRITIDFFRAVGGEVGNPPFLDQPIVSRLK